MSKDIRETKKWKEDCLKWRGKILIGKKAHWCYDWDELPVDETTPEYESCHCNLGKNDGRRT